MIIPNADNIPLNMKRLRSFLLGASALLVFGCNTTPDPILIDESVKEIRITKDGKVTLIR